ncbi:hypothetical protein OIU79_020833, partial [Salix purpurea]
MEFMWVLFLHEIQDYNNKKKKGFFFFFFVCVCVCLESDVFRSVCCLFE